MRVRIWKAPAKNAPDEWTACSFDSGAVTAETLTMNNPTPGIPETAAGELRTLPAGQTLPLRLPLRPTLASGEDTGLVAVMNQFSLMQMQMFEQFQQTMLMMFQMFGSLQQDQMATLRQELDRVQELTRELQSLREALATSPAPQPAVREDPATLGTKCADFSPITTDIPVAGTAQIPVPQQVHAAMPVGNGNGKTMPSNSGPASTAAPQATSKQPAPAQNTQEMHSWLFQRMETIQQERQSRWQKILDMLGAKKS
jgi:hypothetical protein